MSFDAVGSISVIDSGQLGMMVARRPLNGGEENGPVAVTYRTIERTTLAARTGKAGRPPEEIATTANGLTDLSSREQAVVRQLQARDAQVRQEENAHAAAAGDLATAPSYQFQRGPDGRLYAVGGSVDVSARPSSGSPEDLRRLGQRLTAAAVAAINPSGPDQAAARTGDGLKAYGERLAATRSDSEREHREASANNVSVVT